MRRKKRNIQRIHGDVVNWLGRVAAVGDTVSATAIAANKTFVRRCFVASAWQTKMRNGLVYTFSTSTLTGVVCPLSNISTNASLVNFVSSDYSLLTGITPVESSGKQLNSNINCLAIMTDDSAQVSYYSITNQQRFNYPAAWFAPDDGSNRLILHFWTDPKVYWDCWNTSNNRTFVNVSNSLGLFTGTRPDSVTTVILQNGIVLTSVTGTRFSSRPNSALSMFGNESRSCTYGYAGLGLTPAEELAHYQAVQQMQLRLGRAVL